MSVCLVYLFMILCDCCYIVIASFKRCLANNNKKKKHKVATGKNFGHDFIKDLFNLYIDLLIPGVAINIVGPTYITTLHTFCCPRAW